jgi:hypothetical protein
LRGSAAIAQIDENDRTVIAPTGDPPEEHDFAVNVRCAQGAAIVGASNVVDESSQGAVLSSVCRARLLARSG